jgi:hypothetical protein
MGYQLSGRNVVTINGPVFGDFRAAVSVSAVSGGGAGLIFRQAEEGYYVIAAYPGRSSFQSGNLLALYVNSTRTQELDRWPLIKASSSEVRLEVRCQNNVCSVYQGETLRGQLKSISQLEGRIGLCLIGGGQALFKNLNAEEIR